MAREQREVPLWKIAACMGEFGQGWMMADRVLRRAVPLTFFLINSHWLLVAVFEIYKDVYEKMRTINSNSMQPLDSVHFENPHCFLSAIQIPGF
ncbi:hypothetical protein NA56DRAFT_712654 [Hyaloscypha hepaticicola]|uniref:Uncharacterized protein n=1 Tax=Hyaloscypha hepaticicola TaxID=2082293 RepID=A0A2J6PFS2_9HELO|nr:hypothetical protein NA56DRAFT_712654 [Hyaloscypha hepaticicola]